MDLKYFLFKHDINYGDFCDKAGISRTTLYYILEGRRYPGKKALRGILSACEGRVTEYDLKNYFQEIRIKLIKEEIKDRKASRKRSSKKVLPAKNSLVTMDVTEMAEASVEHLTLKS